MNRSPDQDAHVQARRAQDAHVYDWRDYRVWKKIQTDLRRVKHPRLIVQEHRADYTEISSRFLGEFPDIASLLDKYNTELMKAEALAGGYGSLEKLDGPRARLLHFLDSNRLDGVARRQDRQSGGEENARLHWPETLGTLQKIDDKLN